MRRNALKAGLAEGRAMLGVSVMIPSPQAVEMVGYLGFDWVLLDCEHGTLSVESLEVMTMAAEAAGVTAVARPRSRDPDAILEVLERGVAGVQVPHVGSAAQAREVVEAVKYHPLGRRGLAARTRPARYGMGITLDEYARRSNEETLVCVQLEDVEALNGLEETAAVEGVDVLFLGPSDLSQSLGHPGHAEHPAVREAMRDAFGRIARSGRTSGSAGGAAACAEYRAAGATYLYTHLSALLADGAGHFLKAFEDKPEAAATGRGRHEP